MKNTQLQEILYRYANTKGVGLPLTAEEMLNAVSSWLVDTLPECIDIQTTTLPAGSQATAELSGSGTPDDHYIIKVGIPQGATGPAGATGPQGPQGPKGEQGEQGIGYNYMGNWVSQNEYHENDNVTYNGTTYVCIEAVNGSSATPDTDTTHWHVFAAAANKDNFPLSAQNQLYAHYIQLYNVGGDNAIQAQMFVINSDATAYNTLSSLLEKITACTLIVGVVVLASTVGTAPAGRYMIVRNVKVSDDLEIVIAGMDAPTYGEISLTDNFTIKMYDTVIALGSNNGANALVLYADENGVILDSDSEAVIVQKMLSMTEKGTDFNAVVSAMEANGYKLKNKRGIICQKL